MGATMTQYEAMENHILTLIQTHGDQSASLVEDYLEKELETIDLSDKLDVLEALIHRLDRPTPDHVTDAVQNNTVAKAARRLLGEETASKRIAPDALLQEMADAVNQLLDTLDQTVNPPLQPFFETQGAGNYADHLRNALCQFQDAAQKAAHANMMEILATLSPEKIKKDVGISKLTPMRKTKYYDAYEERFKHVENWFESGQFMVSFKNELEKNWRP